MSLNTIPKAMQVLLDAGKASCTKDLLQVWLWTIAPSSGVVDVAVVLLFLNARSLLQEFTKLGGKSYSQIVMEDTQ